MNKYKAIIIILLATTLMFSCNTQKKAVCEDAIPAKLIKKQLDGCSWLIQLESGQVLEPINLKEFDIEKKNNKKIWIVYEHTKGYVSICMAGPIVKVKCLSER